jgi:hypothetical protein
VIDVAIPADRNAMQKEAEKKLNCKSLYVDTKLMWHMKCVIVLVITVAPGIVRKGLKKDWKAIPRNSQ